MRTREVPSTECAFAVLDAPAGSGKDARQELLFQMESLLPQPLDLMHAVFAKVDGKVLVCAIERERIEEFRATHDRLVPDAIPDWTKLQHHDQLLAQLNLLSGEMRSFSSIKRSKRTMKTSCVCALLVSVLLVLGVSRRLKQINQRERSINEQIALVYEEVLPRASAQNAQPEPVRFATMLNAARSTRTGVSGPDQPDLVRDLSDLLNHWPKISNLQVHSIDVQQRTTRLMLSVPENDHSTQLMDKLIAMPDWELASRNITPRADRVEINAVLTRRTQGGAE